MKNSQLHIALETALFNSVKYEAEKYNVSVSELVRMKLRDSSQLTKIEMLLEELNKKLSRKKKGGLNG